MLHASALFSQGECPPVLCFSMGSLGFLLPFPIESFVDVLRGTLAGPVSILYRMRLACTPLDDSGNVLARCNRTLAPRGWQVMNEVALNRGAHSHLAVLDAYLNGERLTTGIADGLLLSTPTGSTAYNLSSGGPIAHPEADVLLLTPVAPRSLSFRPVVLPGSARVRLQIGARARAPALLSLDGRDVGELNVGESVDVRRSPWPIPCIERGGGPGTGWVKDINSLLLFNTGFVNSREVRDR
ncbi:NADH kinase pos5 [Vanrija albida]|uniref:NADH kinase pos5 n=1 Tax=Vanrija albida TaxID=181172 RepID=A0ABR3PWQ0_9TREE